MAFKMKKTPMFVNSPEHKSALKAKSSQYVLPVSGGGDAGLIQAGKELGLSRVPHAIDFTIKYDPYKKFQNNPSQAKEKPEKEDPPKDDNQNTNNANQTTENNNNKINDTENDQELNNDDGSGSTIVTGETGTTVNNVDIENPNQNNQVNLVTLQTIMPTLVQTGRVDKDIARATNQAITNIRSSNGSDRFVEAAEGFFGEIDNAEDLLAAEARMQYNDETDQWELKPSPQVISLPQQNIQQIPTNTPEFEMPSSADYIPPQTNYAHENSKYDEIAMPTKPNRRGVDGAGPDLSTTTDEVDPRSRPGYQILVNDVDGEKKAVVLYNGHIVNIDELPPEISDQEMADGRTVRETYIDIQDENELKEVEKSVTNNEGQVITVPTQEESQSQSTPGPINPNIEFQPYPEETETVKPVIRNPRNNMRKYKWNQGKGGWLPGGKEQYEKDMERYKNQNKENTSAAQMRDDKIYNNAVPGGPVQMNMIKNGYVPK